MQKRVILSSLFLLAGCGAGQWADRIDLAKVAPTERTASLRIRLFDQSMEAPQGKEIIGSVQGVSCQNKVWDAPATKGDALDQLRIKALRAGADAVTGITYSERGTSYKPNCWASVIVSGIAVKL